MKRSLRKTYLFLCGKLEGKELSLRKQVCFQYFKWAYSTRDEDKEKLVDLAKLWRKTEGRYGSYRTLLERNVRKLFRKVSLMKKVNRAKKNQIRGALQLQVDGRGIHSPEWVEKRYEMCLEAVKVRLEKGKHSNIFDWVVYHEPTGRVFKVRGLKRFCKENNLDQRHMWKSVRQPNSTYKGWRAERYSEEVHGPWDYTAGE